MAKLTLGEVTHYFEKISVAVIKLKKGDLKIGDTINFEFKDRKKITQIVESMQIEHANIDMARAGDEFGLKTSQVVQIGTKITKDK